jgi:hypothetical protein
MVLVIISSGQMELIFSGGVSFTIDPQGQKLSLEHRIMMVESVPHYLENFGF